MLHTKNEFEVLAERVERGDVSAATEMRRLLAGALGPVVRRALRGRGTSELDQRIRTAALRVAGGEDDRSRPDGVAARTGGSLAARLVGRLRAGADSVRVGYETAVA
jgi:hypothetical protein